MKVSIIFEAESEADGEDMTIMLEADNVTTVEDILYFYGRSMSAAGFSYITRLEAYGESGKPFWSEF